MLSEKNKRECGALANAVGFPEATNDALNHNCIETVEGSAVLETTSIEVTKYQLQPPLVVSASLDDADDVDDAATDSFSPNTSAS